MCTVKVIGDDREGVEMNCPVCDIRGKVVGMPMSIQWCEEHGLFSVLTGEVLGRSNE